MAFKYEHLTRKDIEIYNLNNLYKKYSKLSGDVSASYDELNEDFSWMIDRDREIWFIRLGIGTIVDNPPIYTGEDYYILHYKGQNIEVLMQENKQEGSSNINCNPFKIRWEVLSIETINMIDTNMKEIISLISEAMISKGYVFLGKQLPNIDVKVKYVGETS